MRSMQAIGGGGAAGGGMVAAPGFARDARPSSIEGCYRIVLDTTPWLRGLPERFALDRDTAGQAVVRGVSLAGRLDSLLADSRWRPVSPNGASVELVSRPAGERVTLQLTANTSRAEARAGRRFSDVGLQRTACRP